MNVFGIEGIDIDECAIKKLQLVEMPFIRHAGIKDRIPLIGWNEIWTVEVGLHPKQIRFIKKLHRLVKRSQCF